jgi:hypothetical protein
MKFIVYLTKYSGDKLPPWYIGSSTKDRIEEGYTGSVTSRKWKEIYYSEKEKNPNLFKTRILSYHETRCDAVCEEYRLHKMHNVVKSDKYFNEAYATKGGCFTRDKAGELNPMYGRGELVSGNKNGRHSDNFKGDIKIVSKNISAGLRRTDKNKKGNNHASKKYYVYYKPLDLYMDIDKGYLYNFTKVFGISYTGLWNTIKTKKPLNNRSKTPGYQLFEGTYNES